MCFLTVFVFSSAIWWKNAANPRKVFVAYAGPGACLILWLCFKAHRYYFAQQDPNRPFRWWTDLSPDAGRFKEIIASYEERLYLRDARDAADLQEDMGRGRAELAGVGGRGRGAGRRGGDSNDSDAASGLEQQQQRRVNGAAQMNGRVA